jgi:hypothetical protein
MRVLLAIVFAAMTPAMKHTTADTATAQASLVKVSDLGMGWTGKASAQRGVVLSCSGHSVSGAGIVETGAASSPTFSHVPGTFVSQNTSVYASTSQANAYWRRAVTPALVTCAAQTLEALRSRGITVSITSRGKLAVSTPLAHAAAYRVVATVGKNKLTYYLDAIVLGSGRAITSLAIITIEAPTSMKVENALTGLVVSRLHGPGAAA